MRPSLCSSNILNRLPATTLVVYRSRHSFSLDQKIVNGTFELMYVEPYRHDTISCYANVLGFAVPKDVSWLLYFLSVANSNL